MDQINMDAYVVDVLMPDLVGHDRKPGAFLVYVYLWRRTFAVGLSSVAVPLQELAECTGLSKRGVQNAIGRLVERGLVRTTRESITAVAEFTLKRPWARR